MSSSVLRTLRRWASPALLLFAVGTFMACDPEEAPKPQPVTPSRPEILSVKPQRTAAGGRQTVSGKHFSATKASNQISFYAAGSTTPIDLPADSIKTASDTSVVFNLPRTFAVGTYALRLAVDGRADTLMGAFEVFTRPVVNSVQYAQVVPGMAFIISGANFSATAANNIVTLNSHALTVLDATTTRLVVEVPTTVPVGSYPVAVTVNSVTSQGNPSVAIVAAPTITSFTPNQGGAGTTVTITGTGFNSPTVMIGGSAATVTASTATSITCTVPSGLTPDNAYPVKVTSNRVQVTATGTFTYRLTPVLTSIEYGTYVVGQSLKIFANNLSATPANNQIKIGTTTLSVGAVSVGTPGYVEVTIPSSITVGTHAVSVVVNGITSSNSLNIAVATAPTITSFTPTQGGAGTTLTITGTGFSSPTVMIGGSAATVTASTATSITCTVPSGLTPDNAYPVKVTSNRVQVTATSTFTYRLTPVLTSTEHSTYVPGQKLRVYANNLSATTGNNIVRIGISNLTATAVSVGTPGYVEVTIPAGYAAGTYAVTLVVNGIASSNSIDITLMAAPTITSFTPTQGGAGVNMTITGTGFSSPTVIIGTLSAPVTASTATSITCTVPSGLTSGTDYVVKVTSNRVVVTAVDAFTYQAAPVLDKTEYSDYAHGQTIRVYASNLSATLSENVIMVGSTNVTATTVVTGTGGYVEGTLPSSTPTGSRSVTLRVRTTASTNSKVINVFEALSITSFTPTTAGPGAPVTISGKGFNNPTVKIGGTTATVSSSTATSITFIVPSTGLTLGNSYPLRAASNREEVTASEVFTFRERPNVTSLSVTAEFIEEDITIYGAHLSTGTPSETSVTIGGQTATVSSVSATAITCRIPQTLTAGVYPVVVTVKGAASNSDVTIRAKGYVGSLSATTATAGTQLKLTGRGFNPESGKTTIKIQICNAIGCSTIQNATVVSATTTEVVFTVPAGLTVGTDYTVGETVVQPNYATGNLSYRPGYTGVVVFRFN